LRQYDQYEYQGNRKATSALAGVFCVVGGIGAVLGAPVLALAAILGKRTPPPHVTHLCPHLCHEQVRAASLTTAPLGRQR
jgi:hypothetical protein